MRYRAQPLFNCPSSVIHRQRRGTLLLLVLVVVMMLTLSAYSFTQLMEVENRGTHLQGQQLQTRMMAESGIAVAESILQMQPDYRESMGGLYDNPDMFRGILIYPNEVPEFQGRYSIVAPVQDEQGMSAGVRFGLEDESARVNLNALTSLDEQSPGAGKELLMALPGMTDEIADAILDYIDQDEEPREFGVEAEHYSTLTPPYLPKNGPLESVEELLLVRGMHPYLLFGRDANRNGIVDSHEMAPAPGANPLAEQLLASIPPRGWASYLTLHSMESNTNSQGLPRIYINEEDLQVLHDNLLQRVPEEWADFIVAYRQHGPFTGTVDQSRAISGVPPLDLTAEGGNNFNQVLDLVGSAVQFQEGDETSFFMSPFEDNPIAMALYLPQIMDNLTINPSPVIPGRININQAPYEILLGIPGLEVEQVDLILQTRVPHPGLDFPQMTNETWLLTEAIVDLEQMKALMPFVCAGGDVYRAQVVGYFQGGSSFSRHEVIIDGTQLQPRIALWRELTHLGRGHSLDVLGVQLGMEGAPLP